MRKFFILAVIITCVSCDNKEFDEVNTQYEEILSTKNEKEKQDPNFKIFNDHFQKGKGETK